MSLVGAQGATGFPRHLCLRCEQIVDSLLELNGKERLPHYDSFADVLISAELGCYICRSLAVGWELKSLDNSKCLMAYSQFSISTWGRSCTCLGYHETFYIAFSVAEGNHKDTPYELLLRHKINIEPVECGTMEFFLSKSIVERSGAR
jgi:hypothetical protein